MTQNMNDQQLDQHFQQKVDNILDETGQRAVNSIETLYTDINEAVRQRETFARSHNQQSPRSGQGEHVINKSVLRIQEDIIDKFVFDTYKKRLSEMTNISKTSSIYCAYNKTNIFSSAVIHNIENVMAASIPQNEFYYDTNQLVYKNFLRLLREFAGKHMKHLYTNPRTDSPYLAPLQRICSLFNQKLIYVDKIAKDYWSHHGGNTLMYEEARQQVNDMLSKLEGNIHFWVGEVRRLN